MVKSEKQKNNNMGISINGKNLFGSNISINGNKIIIDGKDVTPNEKVINIVVNGNIDNLGVDSCDKIEIHGDVNKLKNMSGDIECGNIKESVSSGSGNIKCKGYIGGDVETGSGNVTCDGNIAGNVKTGSGNIKFTKVVSLMKD